MPRDVVVLSAEPFRASDASLAAPAFARGLFARAMEGGRVIQWCRPDGAAVMSLLGARGMDRPELAEVQLGEAPRDGEVFWCEGAVAWGPDGDVALEVLTEMAALVSGRVLVGAGGER